MPDFPPAIDDLITEFDELDDWDERYDLLIDLGRQLPPLAIENQTDDNLVHGCMSTVWLAIRVVDPIAKTIEISADSDSIIVKGLIVVLLSHYNGLSAGEILASDAIELFGRLGLNQHLSPQRRNGLYAMVKRLKQLVAQI
jgi:cysteine desulfuration protein SufE